MQDLDYVLHFYPYVRGPFNYDCADDPWESGKPPFSPGHDGAGDEYKGDVYWRERNHDDMMQKMAEQLAAIGEKHRQL